MMALDLTEAPMTKRCGGHRTWECSDDVRPPGLLLRKEPHSKTNDPSAILIELFSRTQLNRNVHIVRCNVCTAREIELEAASSYHQANGNTADRVYQHVLIPAVSSKLRSDFPSSRQRKYSKLQYDLWRAWWLC